MTTSNYNTNRRTFLKLGLGATALAAYQGCSPFVKPTQEQDAASEKYVESAVGKDFAEQSLANLASGAKAHAFTPVAWNQHAQQLGDRTVKAMTYVNNLGTTASKVVEGQDLVFHRILHSLYSNRADVEEALKLDANQRKQFAKSFVSGLSTDKSNKLDDTLRNMDALEMHLRSYGENKADIQFVQDTLRGNGYQHKDLAKSVQGQLDSYLGNAARIQANARAQLFLKVAECDYAGVSQLIDLDDLLESSRGYQSLIAQGREAGSKISVMGDTREQLLQDFQKDKVADAEARFRSHGRNFKHNIINYDRSPVARAILNSFANKELSTQQAQGAYHNLDLKLVTASKVTPDEDNLLESIASWIPGVMLIESFPDWALFGTPDTPNGKATEVFKACGKAYTGFPSFRAGSEDPTGRALFALFVTGVEAALIYAGFKYATKNGNGNGGQPNVGVGGGMTGGPGIRPQ